MPNNLFKGNEMANEAFDAASIQSQLLGESDNITDDKSIKTWNAIVSKMIDNMSHQYTENNIIRPILRDWQKNITLDYKHHSGFTPHINGFYMIFMVHGPWYSMYQKYLNTNNEAGLSLMPDSKKMKPGAQNPMTQLSLINPNSAMNFLATDIDVPDLTEEYTAVSQRLRNSFVPSRNYFVSDFNISYIENINLDIMRYHEAWHKFMHLMRRGEFIPKNDKSYEQECKENNNGYFLDMPFANAVWVAIFKPFTTEIQMLIKLVGVMPVTMPLKQVIGNRSQSKMTVLNISYKAADIFYKFYNGVDEFIEDTDKGMLAKSFKNEVLSVNQDISSKLAI